MPRYLTCAICALILVGISFRSIGCEQAAGVVAYSKIEGEIKLLVADHKINPTRGWAAFGGCVDEGESIEIAALRELHEETRCALAPYSPITTTTPRVSFGKFTSFALEVPFIAAETIETIDLAPHCKSILAERGPWAWVELSTLLATLPKEHAHNAPFPAGFLPDEDHRWFWYKSTRVIRALHELGAFQ
ncbi:MAG: NUDIX hydrolase [Pseudomonadota bacterium]